MRSVCLRLLLPLLSIATLVFAIVMHEAAHLMATWVSGGTLIGIDLLSSVPHITVTASASRAVEAWRTAAGSGLPVALYWGILMLYGSSRSIVTQTLLIFSLVEFTGWIACSLQPGVEMANDAGAFIQATGWAPGSVAALCSCLAALFVSTVALRFQTLSAPVL